MRAAIKRSKERSVGIRELKATASAVVRESQTRPVLITVNGYTQAVVIGIEQWKQMQQQAA